MPVRRVVVVGGGLAGARTCEALLRSGFPGHITLLGRERHAPYDRPPLSKDVLTKGISDTTLDLDLTGADVRLGVEAHRLRGQVVVTDAGDFEFDALVVASGAEPVALPGQGAASLRTIDDALALREQLRPGTRLVVVGAGWIGAEVASAAAAAGCRVTVVDTVAVPLAGALGPEVAEVLLPWWREAGIELMLGRAVRRADADRVTLADGQVITADAVLVAVGVRAATGWLSDSGVRVERGVLTDSAFRSVSRPEVFAVGDAAARWSPRYGRVLRVQHWDVALRSPDVAAAALRGEAAPADDPVPYVWSEQFGRTVQLVGDAGPADRLIWRGQVRDGDWTACWVDPEGRLRAVATCGRPRDLTGGRRRIIAGRPCDLDLLAREQPGLRDV